MNEFFNFTRFVKLNHILLEIVLILVALNLIASLALITYVGVRLIQAPAVSCAVESIQKPDAAVESIEKAGTSQAVETIQKAGLNSAQETLEKGGKHALETIAKETQVGKSATEPIQKATSQP
jgi:hypothetical protein